jgi:hypothetical protein
MYHYVTFLLGIVSERLPFFNGHINGRVRYGKNHSRYRT